MTHHGPVRTDRLTSALGPWLAGAGAGPGPRPGPGTGPRPGPAYHRLAAGVRSLVVDGCLPPGTRVPAERVLAAALGVSRTTVTAAYDVLRAEGYLVSAHGAGSHVALPAPAPQRPDAPPGEPAEPAGVLDLTVAAWPAPPGLTHAVAAAAADLPPLLAGHGMHPFGLPALREAVARHLTAGRLPTAAEQVFITSGALQGWNLLLQTLTRPGDRVLVEQPTYPAVVDAVAAHHRRAVPVPVGPHGWDLPGAHGAALAHVTPDGQNPTGLLADAARRTDLLHRLGGTRPVVDETFVDLLPEGRTPPRLGTLRGDVVSLGSLAKSFWAGLRIGWVRADPDLVVRLARARTTLDLGVPVLEQLVAVHLLATAPQVLPARRARLLATRHAVLEAVARDLPGWRCPPAVAGPALWLELPAVPGAGATRLAAHALDLGLRLAPGPRFTVDGTADRFLRLPLTIPADDAPAVVHALAQAWHRTCTGPPPGRTAPRWTA